jgi:hypothetical protein
LRCFECRNSLFACFAIQLAIFEGVVRWLLRNRSVTLACGRPQVRDRDLAAARKRRCKKAPMQESADAREQLGENG